MAQQKLITETEGPCAKCGNSANTRCKGCLEGLDIHGESCSATFYCSKDCQRAHWETHKQACKGANYRKQLYRVAELAQTIFFDTRGAEFDIKIAKMTEKENCLFVEEGYYEEGESFVKFPEGVFSSRESEHAMLAWSSCAEATFRMHRIFAPALKGSYKEMYDVSLPVSAAKLRVDFTNGRPKPLGHSTFKIYLRDGNVYAMDFSGAQFGLHRTVIPWEEFCKFFDITVQPKEFPGNPSWDDDQPQDAGWLGKAALYTADELTNEDMRRIRHLLERNVWCCVYSASNAWISKFEKGAAEMVMQSEGNYKQDSELLCSFIKQQVVLFIDWVKTLGAVKVLNAFPIPFEEHLRTLGNGANQEAQEQEHEQDSKSGVKYKQPADHNMWPEVGKAFRKLQTNT